MTDILPVFLYFRDAVTQAQAIERKVATVIYLPLVMVNDKGLTSGFDSVWQKRTCNFVKTAEVRFNEFYMQTKAAGNIEPTHELELIKIHCSQRAHRGDL